MSSPAARPACKHRERVSDSPLTVEEHVLPYEAKAGTFFVKARRTLRLRLNPHELGSSPSKRQGGDGMSELKVAEDGRYLSGDVPFGYTLWEDRLVEVPSELDACVTAIRLVKQGKNHAHIAAAVREEHGVEMSQRQFDGLMTSVYRRYGPI
jgi:hypothetical protein